MSEQSLGGSRMSLGDELRSIPEKDLLLPVEVRDIVADRLDEMESVPWWTSVRGLGVLDGIGSDDSVVAFPVAKRKPAEW